MKTKEKFLFVLDLDGTVLKNSRTSEIHPNTVKAVKRATEEGHVVVIATGRPWRASKKAYETLKLKTPIINYNGAHIHNPSDYTFIPVIKYMNVNEALYILNDAYIKKYIKNIAIEGPGWVQIQKRDNVLEDIFGFSSASKLTVGINPYKLPLKPTGVIFDTKKGVNIEEIKDYLFRKYGDLGEFSSWSKGEGLTPVVDITSVGASKGTAIALMARYFDIELDNIIAIGDSYNDMSMFKVSGVSVSMANSTQEIKNATIRTTKKTNKNGGVGEYISHFLDNTQEEHKNCIAKRKEMLSLKVGKTTTLA